MAPPPAGPALAPLFDALLGEERPLHVSFWDGTSLGRDDAPARIVVRRPEALRRILFAPTELGLARAYVSGDLDVEGDLAAALDVLWDAHPGEFRLSPRLWARAARAAASLGVLGPPPPPPPEEARLRGRLHTLGRDAGAIAHHYDVSNDFYRLVLGPSMTYSCARFGTRESSLEDAQAAKFDLVCRKLGLRPGQRLLDVGCGWGSMVIHAASTYRVDAVGITLSRAQADLARKRVAEAGLTDHVEIRIQDYRELRGERFDAISSIGMFEHVGHRRSREYFARLAEALVPQGRLLNHAISTPEGAVYDRRSFIARYVFPDGELQDVGATIEALETSGLEARDVESLREHYPLTLRQWVANLEEHWDEAVALAGEGRARVWRLYMTGAASAFDSAEISVHQLLAVKPAADGSSGLPLTRRDWG